MAKDKDKALNPAAAHRKQEKQKALKKGTSDYVSSHPVDLSEKKQLTMCLFYRQSSRRRITYRAPRNSQPFPS